MTLPLECFKDGVVAVFLALNSKSWSTRTSNQLCCFYLKTKQNKNHIHCQNHSLPPPSKETADHYNILLPQSWAQKTTQGITTIIIIILSKTYKIMLHRSIDTQLTEQRWKEYHSVCLAWTICSEGHQTIPSYETHPFELAKHPTTFNTVTDLQSDIFKIYLYT